jgi:proteasome lid subunit RPN8/RPN11
VNEVCYVLVGQRRGRIWYGRLRQRQVGDPASVQFDWAWVLDREERRGDILGFFHTHPPDMRLPSQRDVRTMHAWVSCLGKPLLCLIAAGGAFDGYLFANDEDEGQTLDVVERFQRDVIVAVQGEETGNA